MAGGDTGAGSSRLQRGTLEWTGEHWISMLRPGGGTARGAGGADTEDSADTADIAVVSHYSLRISPAGEGNVAVARVGGEGGDGGLHAVCTDNAALLDWAIPRLFGGSAYWHATLPVYESTFTRWGDATRGRVADRHRGGAPPHYRLDRHRPAGGHQHPVA